MHSRRSARCAVADLSIHERVKPVTTKTSSTRLWLMPTLIAVGATIVLIAVFFWGRSSGTSDADSQAESQSAEQGAEEAEKVPDEIVDQVITRDPDDPLAIGPAD